MNHGENEFRIREAVCDEFEQFWLQDSTVTVEDFLQAAKRSLDAETVQELILVEMDLRHAAGDNVTAKEYQVRFPAYGRTIEQGIKRIDALGKTRFVTSSQTLVEDLHIRHRSWAEIPTQVGKYRLIRRIGQGGFGVVFKALCSETGKAFALKFPEQRSLDSLAELKSITAEADLARALDHPNIVRTHGLGVHDTFVFVVQEYVCGGALSEHKSLDPKTSVRIAIDIAEGLNHAHQQGLIHRDLKPGNVLLNQDGTALVADFGLTIHESFQRRLRGQRCGTLHYMSPEQVLGLTHQLDGRSDIWSLGVTLYRLLTDKLPFDGESKEEVYEEIQFRNEKPLRMLRPELDGELQRIVSKCLAKSIRDRYATAGEVADDLRSWFKTSNKRLHTTSHPLIPRGLSAYRKEDAAAFIDIIPGRRNRDGIPDIIDYFKTRVEDQESEFRLSLGALLGPSGSGKSSIVRAGLIPRLNPNRVRSFYFQAHSSGNSECLTEEIHRVFCGSLDGVDPSLTFPQMLDGIRNGQWIPKDQKLLIVIDQFEQTLLGNQKRSSILQALRHCDGERLSCLVIVRDDFWGAFSAQLQEMGVYLHEDRNLHRVGFLDRDEAIRILWKLGHAVDRLPDMESPLSRDAEHFLQDAVDGFGADGPITPVQLALLTEIFRHRKWSRSELRRIGGVSGIGEAYLEQSLSHAAAVEAGRWREIELRFAHRVLADLLPPSNVKVRSHPKSLTELANLEPSLNRAEAGVVLQRMDRELRLVVELRPENELRSGAKPVSNSAIETDAGTEAESYYQLSHDYMVHSVRNWLARRQREHWRGRAQLKYEELFEQWRRSKEVRFLPSIKDHVAIRLSVPASKRTRPQNEFLNLATRRHFAQTGLVLSVLLLTSFLLGALWKNSADSEMRERIQRAAQGGTSEFRQEEKDLLSSASVAVRILKEEVEFLSQFPVREALLYELLGASTASHHARMVDALQSVDASEFRLIVRVMQARGDHFRQLIGVEFIGNCTPECQARLAAALIGLDDLSAATRLFRNRENPTAATLLAHKLAQLQPREALLIGHILGSRQDSDSLFGLLVAASRYPFESWNEREQAKLRELLQREYLEHPDAGVHAMCRYLAHRWGFIGSQDSLNEAASSTWRYPPTTLKPRAGFDWWNVALGDCIDQEFVWVEGSDLILDPPTLPIRVEPFFVAGQRHTIDGFWISQQEIPVDVIAKWRSAIRNQGPDAPVTELTNSEKITIADSNKQNLADRVFARFENTASAKGYLTSEGQNASISMATFNELQACADFYSEVLKERQPNQEVAIPTANQFEVALRGGSKSRFHFGDSDNVGFLLDAYAATDWSEEQKSDHSRLVVNRWRFLPNRNGLFNAIGNLAEYARLTPEELEQLGQEPLCWRVGGIPNNLSYSFQSGYVERGSANHGYGTTGVRFTIQTCRLSTD